MRRTGKGQGGGGGEEAGGFGQHQVGGAGGDVFQSGVRADAGRGRDDALEMRGADAGDFGDVVQGLLLSVVPDQVVDGGGDIGDLDITVNSSRGSRLAADDTHDNWPLVEPDRPFCTFDDDTFAIEVSSKKGSGPYALEVWKLPAR